MKRVAAQCVFCSSTHIKYHSVVEQSDAGIIQRIFPLHETQAEPANTLFYDGIISLPVISLKASGVQISDEILSGYQIIDLTENTDKDLLILNNNKKLIIDFGIDDILSVNSSIETHQTLLQQLSFAEIIAACTSTPALLTGSHSELKEGICTNLILWQQVDFSTKKLSKNARISLI